jgi:ribonuclease HII
MTDQKKASSRVAQHLETLRAAGLSTEEFFDAMVSIRDDSALSNTHREAIYRMIAMESYVWYLEALRGEPIDRLKLMQEARKTIEEHSAAIKKPTPGGPSAALLQKDIGKKK